jgi:hypothetical protein
MRNTGSETIVLNRTFVFISILKGLNISIAERWPIDPNYLEVSIRLNTSKFGKKAFSMPTCSLACDKSFMIVYPSLGTATGGSRQQS